MALAPRQGGKMGTGTGHAGPSNSGGRRTPSPTASASAWVDRQRQAGQCPAASQRTRLVEVPMSVQVPPNTVANESGMSSFFGGTPHLFRGARKGSGAGEGARGGKVGSWA